MRRMMIAAVAAAALISTSAIAAVSFNYDTGTGFVGKGDVSVLYGWNNAQAKANMTADTLSFYTLSSSEVEATCEWTTGVKKKTTHRKVRKIAVIDANAVTFDVRNNKNGTVTGINLLGYGADLGSTTDAPEVGSVCLGDGNEDNGANGIITSVVEVPGSDSGDMLYVSFGGVDYALPNTPIVTTTI